MSIPHILVIVSACVSFLGAWAYIRGTVRGQTKPNRVSWTMWALAPLVGTAAALAAHADIWATSRTFLAGFIPLLVLVFSVFNRQSYWKLTVFDLACGAFSLLALAMWLGADSPRYAVLLSALGDGFAALPTIRKAWKNPETETGLTYLAGLVAVLLVLPSIAVWNVENSAFQIYLLIVNSILVFSVFRRRMFRR